MMKHILRVRHRKLWISSLFILALLAGCGAPEPPPTPNAQKAAAAAAATAQLQEIEPMAGPVWRLTTLNGVEVPEQSIFTALFGASGQLTILGDAACNKYDGTLTLNGDQMKITLGEASMKAACPQDVDQLEGSYYSMLESTASYALDGDQLILYDAAQSPSGIYVAETTETDPLVGTAWSLTSYANGDAEMVDLLPDSEITARFDINGELSGAGGCNDYFTSYSVDGDQIEIGPPSGTQMACEEALMNQETAYLGALDTATTFEIAAEQLTLKNADDTTVAIFIAASE